jgi:hypothetical protein
VQNQTTNLKAAPLIGMVDQRMKGKTLKIKV